MRILHGSISSRQPPWRSGVSAETGQHFHRNSTSELLTFRFHTDQRVVPTFYVVRCVAVEANVVVGCDGFQWLSGDPIPKRSSRTGSGAVPWVVEPASLSGSSVTVPGISKRARVAGSRSNGQGQQAEDGDPLQRPCCVSVLVVQSCNENRCAAMRVGIAISQTLC